MNKNHGKQLILLAILIFIIVGVSHFIKSQQLTMNYFLPLFYYLPVVFATYFFELPGGLTVGLISVFLCVPLLIKSTQPWLENVVMIEMMSFFIVSYITNKYVQQHQEKAALQEDIPVEDLVDLEEMERGLKNIEPIIKADRERVAFCQIVENIYAFHSLEEKLGVILNTLKNDFASQACSVLLLEPRSKQLSVKISRGLSGSFLKQAHLEAKDGVWAEVIKKRREVLIEKNKADANLLLEKDFQTFLALPLISRQQVLGILHLESAHEHAFSPMDVEIAWDFANLTAILIDNANLMEENRSLAVIDQTTGMFNYNYFHIKVEDYIKESLRYGKIFSLIVIELVNFYNFKTFHGKERTSEILKEMAKAIKSCLRGVDLVTRIGENEFSLLLPETDLKGAQVSAERINKKLTQEIFGSLEPDILLCLGLVEFPKDGNTLPSILAKARANLHESCRSKRENNQEDL